MKELSDKITVKQKDVTDRQKKVEEMREVNQHCMVTRI